MSFPTISHPMFRTVLAGLALTFLLAGCGKDSAPLAPDHQADKSSKAIIPFVHCQGTRCSLPGETKIPGYPDRPYSYIVTPQDGGVSSVKIGLNVDPGFVPQSVIMPPGWSYTLHQSDTLPNRPKFVPHGQVVVASGNSNSTLEFFGPAMNRQFQLAYFCRTKPWPAEWRVDQIYPSYWAQPVGQGLGPVHGPALTGHTPGGTYHGPGNIIKGF